MSDLRNKIRMIEATNENAIADLEKFEQKLDSMVMEADIIPDHIEGLLLSLNIGNEQYEEIYGPFSEIKKMLSQISSIGYEFSKRVEEMKKGLQNSNNE